MFFSVRWSLYKYKCLCGVGGKGMGSSLQGFKSLHKYKCLWGVGGNDRSSSLQEEVSHTHTLRLS